MRIKSDLPFLYAIFDKADKFAQEPDFSAYLICSP